MIEDAPAATAPGAGSGAPAGPAAPDDLFRLIEADLATASGPHGLPRLLRDMLDEIVDCLGEGWIGGPWDARDDLWRHTVSVLDAVAVERLGTLTDSLASWRATARASSPAAILLPLCLWWQATQLWDRSLAYRTIWVVTEAVAQSVAGGTAAAAAAGQPQPGTLEQDVWSAVGQAMEVMTADGEIFKQINLSSPAGLAAVAKDGVTTTESAVAALDRIVGMAERPAGLSLPAWEGLRFIREDSRQSRVYFVALAGVAGALAAFEHWLAASAGPPSPSEEALAAGRPLAADDAPLASVEAALKQLRAAQQELSGRVLSECEPWEHLLAEIRRLLTSGDETGFAGTALMPRRMWMRYCYPFAIEDTEQPSPAHLHPKLARRRAERARQPVEPCLRRRLQEEFDDALGAGAMMVGDPVDLATTEFFQAPGSEDGLFGGVRVDLSPVDITGDRLPGASGDGRGQRCSVWLDLNRMGNFCLCIEPSEPLRDIPPHRLYRAFRAGTPFVFGERVALVRAGPAGQAGAPRPAWDSLQTFARDVIRAAADAYCWKERKDPALKEGRDSSTVAPFVSGNVHLVAIMQTAGPLGAQSDEVAARLDATVGGRIVLRSIQRTASTLTEWIRFPPLQRAGTIRGSVIAAVPEIGYAGDWLVHTGETTVFGIVAVPQWLRAVYPETAEFAGSWAPRLRLWSKRLQRSIDGLRPGGIEAKDAEELRAVEQRVRLHLSQINSEELCATLANRRFLDELLEMAGVGRVQRELEAQLEAAEQLSDWFSQHQEQRSARRRDMWLFIIALLGIFSLADYMALANSTRLHEKWLGFINLSDNGSWEDWFILALFAVAFIVGLFFVLDVYGWLRHRFTSARRAAWAGRAGGRRRGGR